MPTIRHNPVLLLPAAHPKAQRAQSINQRRAAEQPPPLPPPPATPPYTPPQILSLALDIAQAITQAAIEVEPQILLNLLTSHLGALRTSTTRILAGRVSFDLLSPHVAAITQTYPTQLICVDSAPALSITLETPEGATIPIDPASLIRSVRLSPPLRAAEAKARHP